MSGETISNYGGFFNGWSVGSAPFLPSVNANPYPHTASRPGDYLLNTTAILLGSVILVGTGGFKGKADEAGMVEIGYAIVPAYRHRGLATEAARGLVDHAFAHAHIKRVDAHTLAERNASARVLEKVGMRFIGAVDDPDQGEVWHWSLHGADYRQS